MRHQQSCRTMVCVEKCDLTEAQHPTHHDKSTLEDVCMLSNSWAMSRSPYPPTMTAVWSTGVALVLPPEVEGVTLSLTPSREPDKVEREPDHREEPVNMFESAQFHKRPPHILKVYTVWSCSSTTRHCGYMSLSTI